MSDDKRVHAEEEPVYWFDAFGRLWSQRHSVGLPAIPPAPIAQLDPKTGKLTAIPDRGA